MALVMGEQDFSSFNLLVSGMDAKTKVRRLKRLCEIKNQLIEQPFLDRLNYCEDKICKLRDRLAHNALCRDEKEPRFHYMNFDRLPWKCVGLRSYVRAQWRTAWPVIATKTRVGARRARRR
jgi:hypothetical protein